MLTKPHEHTLTTRVRFGEPCALVRIYLLFFTPLHPKWSQLQQSRWANERIGRTRPADNSRQLTALAATTVGAPHPLTLSLECAGRRIEL